MTPGEQKALDYVRDHIGRFGTSPSVTEIGQHFGYSAARASMVVTALVREGLLQRRSGTHRAITIPGAPELRAVPTNSLLAELGRRGVTTDAMATREVRSWSRSAVTCAMDCCDVVVARGHLMCRQHWFALPLDLRNDIMAASGARDVSRYQELVWRAREGRYDTTVAA